MKELVILSGKGGTGKTSLTASFASLAPDAVLADCDVDAANLHLLLRPDVQSREAFHAGREAHVQSEACCGCGCRIRPWPLFFVSGCRRHWPAGR